MPEQPQLLYLFSSNIRPLYEQDVLDLVAFPGGATYRFRYFKRYLSPELRADPKVIVGMRALVNFSIQDPGQYHDPAFLPIRYATICDVEDVGDVLVMILRLGNYCALTRPDDFRKPEQRGKVVREFTQALAGVPHPYPFSAGIGSVMSSDAPIDPSTDQAHLFESIVQFLQGTQSFRDSRFYRVRGVTRFLRGSHLKEAIQPDEQGVFEVEGGSTYAIQVHHFQGAETDGRAGFRVAVDETNIRVIGRPGFDIASRYDLIDLELHAIEPPTSEPRETVISIEPVGEVRGPTTKIRVRVTKSPTKTVVAIGGATVVALFLGIPNIWPGLGDGWKIFFVLAATGLAGLLASFGLKRS